MSVHHNRSWIELKNKGKTWLKLGGGAVGGYFVTKAVVNAQKEEPQQSEEYYIFTVFSQTRRI